MDYGHDVRFGVSVSPDAQAFEATVRLARTADALGLDYLAVQDHPYQANFLDSWTLLTLLLQRTDSVGVFGDVLNLQLRPPLMLAKAAASLAITHPGRIDVGVGGGAVAAGISGMGVTPRRPDQVVDFVADAVQAMRGSLADRPDPVEVWVGGMGPRMLDAVGRFADGWISPLNTGVPPTAVPEKQRLLDHAADESGRDPRDIRRIYNVAGAIGTGTTGPGLVGDVSRWVDTLVQWTLELGFDTFVLWLRGDETAQLQKFSAEIAPAVRERVAAERGER